MTVPGSRQSSHWKLHSCCLLIRRAHVILSVNFAPAAVPTKRSGAKTNELAFYPMSSIERLLMGLRTFPKKSRHYVCIRKEPLLNRRLPDMIRYARQKGVCERIDFTTNGSLLTHDTGLAVADAGVDRINISVEALDDERYYETSGVKLCVAEYIDNLRFFYQHKNGCHVFMKISDLGLGKHSEQDFYDMFGDICDEIAVEHVTDVWPGFAVKEEMKQTDRLDIYGGEMAERKEAQVCPYLFYSMCVNSDGTVSSCLMDWNHVQIIGDASSQTLPEIWNGSVLHEMRIEHLKLNRAQFPACGNCGQMKYAVLDNIDPYADVLLKKVGGI